MNGVIKAQGAMVAQMSISVSSLSGRVETVECESLMRFAAVHNALLAMANNSYGTDGGVGFDGFEPSAWSVELRLKGAK